MIVVNSKKVAEDLFEKRGQIYSDRPYIPMIGLYTYYPDRLFTDKSPRQT